MTIPVENCDIVEEDKQYCARLPTEVLCSNTTVRNILWTVTNHNIFVLR